MGGGARRPAAPSRPAQPPARAASTSTPAPMQPQQQSGGMLSGIGSTIAQGMAFGTGSAIAHRAVGAVAGSFGGGGGEAAPAEVSGVVESPHAQVAQPQQMQGPCAQDKQMFFECLQVNKGDQQACSFLYEQLQECQRGATQMQFS